MNELLLQKKGPTRGPSNAKVTLVEFSDFECPYCRQLAASLDQLSPEEKARFRLIFHHLPLSRHPWARQAAEAAACAQLQGDVFFWTIHDQIFQHQDQLSADNFKTMVMEFAERIDGLNRATFSTCLDNEMSLGLVLRDINLASANNVDATPTLFVNGRRIAGVATVDQLRELISSARAQTGSQ